MSTQRLSTLVLIGTTAALAFPTASPNLFDGLPFSTSHEYLVLALVVAPFCHAAARRYFARVLSTLSTTMRAALLTALVVVVLGKAWLLAAEPAWGFRACYSSLSEPLASGQCERSFEFPFAGDDLTRVDPQLQFGPGEWRLSFVNSLRFNYYPWVAGSILRDRLPFAVRWHGVLDVERPTSVEVVYVGEGTVLVEGRPVLPLAAVYGDPARLRFDVQPGRKRIMVDYRFDDGYRTGTDESPGPLAQFAMVQAVPGAAPVVLKPARPPAAARVVGGLVDVVLGAGLAGFAVVVLRIVRREWWVLIPWTIGLLAVHLVSGRLPLSVPRPVVQFAFALVPFVLVVASHHLRTRVAAWTMVAVVCTERTLNLYSGWRDVSIRSAGEDWLTYESFARTLLETWSLQGGEAVFYYQPFYRYVRFLQRLALGDGEPIVLAASLTTVLAGLLAVAAYAARQRVLARLVAWSACVLGTWLVWLPSVVRWIDLGLSEFVTWMMLPFAFVMLFLRTEARCNAAGTILLAGCAITRFNQAPAILLAFALFAMRAWQQGWHRRLVGLSGIFAALLLLPLLHNVVYGGQFVITTTSADIEQNLVLRPQELVQAAVGGPAADRLGSQIELTLALAADQPADVNRAVRLIQVLWLISAVWAIRRSTWFARLLHLTPIAFLAPHVVYQVSVYYPRHIVAGYLVMAVVSALQAVRRRGVIIPRSERG